MNSARHCFSKRKCRKKVKTETMNDMENGTYHLVMTRLNEDSYGRWIVDIQDVLEGAGLWRIANGLLVKPTPVTGLDGSITNVGNIEDWEKKDSRARALIRRTLGSVTFDQVVDCVNSASILRRIRELFKPKTVNMLMGALREFFVLTWKPEDTVSSFVAGLRVIVRRVESCESSDLGKVNDKWIIAKILGTLPSEYGHFVTTWDLLSSSSLTLDSFVEKLVNAERSLRSRNTEPVVVDAYRLSNSPKKVKDDRKKARSIDGKQSKFNGICYRCKKHGHMSKDCRVKIEDKTESSSNVNSLSAATATKVTDRIIADSGASVHLTGRFDWFESVRKLLTALTLEAKTTTRKRNIKIPVPFLIETHHFRLQRVSSSRNRKNYPFSRWRWRLVSLSRSSKLTIIDKFNAILSTPGLMNCHIVTRIFEQSLKLLRCLKCVVRGCRCFDPFLCFVVIPDEHSKLVLSAFKTERIVRDPVLFHNINDEFCQFPRKIDILSHVYVP